MNSILDFVYNYLLMQQVTDAFVCANDAEWPFARQQSPIVKASLQPTFDFQFYFYNIESRTEASVLIEVRDGKDQFFYGAASVPLKMSLKLLSKPKAPLFYEKTFKLSDPHGESPTPVSGEITLKVIGF